MLINGQWIKDRPTFISYNPATGDALGKIPNATLQDTHHAIEAAAEALKTWRNSSAYMRSDLLHKAWRLMLERQESLAVLMTKEQGKPLKAARNEVKYAADFLLWFSEEAKRNYGETIPSARPDQRFITQNMAIGVVAAITPWNYPISMITRKLAPALAAGCTVVLKPAESTPLCAAAVFEILQEAGIPDGVINLVSHEHPEEIGNVFCHHPLIKKLTFTGSTHVGQKLSTACAPSLKRVSMELGGNAPFIVAQDADPVHAAKGCALVKFLNTGQACISPNRIYVHHSIAKPFIETLKKRIANLTPGNGLDQATQIGPLINKKAVDKMQHQVSDALSKGANCELGGTALSPAGLDAGHFFAPTLLTNVTADMLISQQETFGPIAAVQIYDDEDHMLQRANDTHYGLAAYIYTKDLSRAFKLMEALEFGIIGINDINPTSAAAPFGGMKSSGLGREGAREGLQEYLETKLIGLSVS